MLERLHSLTVKYPLDIITYLSSLIPISAGIGRFAYLGKEHKLIVVFFLSDFFVETLFLLLVIRGQSSWPLQDVKPSLNILFVALIYRQALIRQTQKRLVSMLGLIFLLLSIYFYRADIMSPWSQTAFRVYALGVTLTYYNAILSDLNLKKIQHHITFWFTAGLLFYAGGTFFTMLFNQYMYDQKTPSTIFELYYNLMQILYIVFCLLTTIGFWMSKYDKENYFERNYFIDR